MKRWIWVVVCFGIGMWGCKKNHQDNPGSKLTDGSTLIFNPSGSFYFVEAETSFTPGNCGSNPFAPYDSTATVTLNGTSVSFVDNSFGVTYSGTFSENTVVVSTSITVSGVTLSEQINYTMSSDTAAAGSTMWSLSGGENCHGTNSFSSIKTP